MFITKAIRTNWVAFPHFARRANHTKALQAVLKLYLINVRGVAVPDEFRHALFEFIELTDIVHRSSNRFLQHIVQVQSMTA